jgi:8-hydroxy-5-deazaflavin:NADPH oxidoreductase
MRTKQTIAIIGASGRMGVPISKSLSKGNYRLLLIDKNPESVEALVSEIRKADQSADVELINCYAEASWEADIIITAIPYPEEKEVAGKIRETANQKIVVSISNPLNETYKKLLTQAGSDDEKLQELLPNSKVVRVFNTNFGADFSNPVVNGQQAGALITGDDEEALQTVSELIRSAGFNPIITNEPQAERSLEKRHSKYVHSPILK